MTKLTLYDLEENLLALIDTEEMCPEEQLAEHAAALAETGVAAVAKRDRSIQFIRSVESTIIGLREEEKRLAEKRRHLAAGLDRYEKYLVRVIEMSGQQTSATIKRLKGRLGDLCAVTNSPSLRITDETAIPKSWGRALVEMDEELWDEIVATLRQQDFWDEDLRGCTVAISIDTAAIKAALKRGESVPGADLDLSGMSFRVK
jgi:chromosome segregation ATPase